MQISGSDAHTLFLQWCHTGNLPARRTTCTFSLCRGATTQVVGLQCVRVRVCWSHDSCSVLCAVALPPSFPSSLSLPSFFSFPLPPMPPPSPKHTEKHTGQEKIRLYGIDAPEKTQTCHNGRGQPYACGVVSLEALKERVGSKPVRCEVRRGVETHPARLSHCSAAIAGFGVGAGRTQDVCWFQRQ